MSGTKAISVRLSKAAKECNISVQRAAEYLAEKGIEIEARPNTKLEANAYDLLLEKFQPDLKIKRQSEETTIEQTSRESVAIDYIVEKAAAKEEKQAEAEKAKEEEKEAKEEKVVPETPVAEEKPEPKVETPEVVEEKVEPTPEPPKEEPKAVEEKPEPVKEEPKAKEEKPAAEEVKAEEP